MIFISYNDADTAAVRAFCTQLGQHEIPYWCADDLAAGSSFPREMNDALSKATHLAVLWSITASRSEHVWNEIDAFYARHPQPQRLVFICLDGTNVPALYASRLYLPAGGTPDSWAAALRPWAAGQAAKAEQVGSAACGAAEASFVALVPAGPAVRTKHVSRELIDEYVLHVPDRFAVLALLDEMARLRQAAEPTVPRNQLLTAGELLRIGEVPARDFWIDAFSAAARKGTRTLAALLLAQPDDNFTDDARRDRTALLTRLRTRDASLFT